jgi:hypothetical protein
MPVKLSRQLQQIDHRWFRILGRWWNILGNWLRRTKTKHTLLRDSDTGGAQLCHGHWVLH